MKKYSYAAHYEDVKHFLSTGGGSIKGSYTVAPSMEILMITYERWVNDKILMSLEAGKCPAFWWFHSDSIPEIDKEHALLYCLEKRIDVENKIREKFKIGEKYEKINYV